MLNAVNYRSQSHSQFHDDPRCRNNQCEHHRPHRLVFGSVILLSNGSGGIVDLVANYPEYNTSDSQNNPMLQARSFKGASVHNFVISFCISF